MAAKVKRIFRRFIGLCEAWFEWRDALDWASQYHPAWVEIAKRARHEETRKEYKRKILLAYKGYDYV